MKELIPLKVRWSALWPAYLCNDREMMDLAAKSGLLHLNIGIESIDQETLMGLNKSSNKVKQYREILGNLRKRNISYSLNFIFGTDTEKADIFPSTLAFLRRRESPGRLLQHTYPAQRNAPLRPHGGRRQDHRYRRHRKMARHPLPHQTELLLRRGDGNARQGDVPEVLQPALDARPPLLSGQADRHRIMDGKPRAAKGLRRTETENFDYY